MVPLKCEMGLEDPAHVIIRLNCGQWIIENVSNPFHFIDYIVGVTMILSSAVDIKRTASQGEEIAAHLKAHTNENYVVLDDSDGMLRDQWSHLILVNDENGFTDTDV